MVLLPSEVIKNCQSVSSRVAVLILRARQETPATLALVLDAIITRIVNEDGVIFKEARTTSLLQRASKSAALSQLGPPGLAGVSGGSRPRCRGSGAGLCGKA